jgi:hypothetical protein
MKRRYESHAKRGLPLCRAPSPHGVSSLRPRLRMVSIMPGIDTARPSAPHEQRQAGSPKRLPAVLLEARERLATSARSASDTPPCADTRGIGARDGEARRHRHAEVHHLGEIRALAAEESPSCRACRRPRHSRRSRPTCLHAPGVSTPRSRGGRVQQPQPSRSLFGFVGRRGGIVARRSRRGRAVGARPAPLEHALEREIAERIHAEVPRDLIDPRLAAMSSSRAACRCRSSTGR